MDGELIEATDTVKAVAASRILDATKIQGTQ